LLGQACSLCSCFHACCLVLSPPVICRRIHVAVVAVAAGWNLKRVSLHKKKSVKSARVPAQPTVTPPPQVYLMETRRLLSLGTISVRERGRSGSGSGWCLCGCGMEVKGSHSQ
jgi:hypothetical protein